MAINPLQLPGALPSNNIDFQGSLAALGQTWQQAQVKAARDQALQGAQLDGSPQSLSALATKLLPYDQQGAMTLAQLANTQANTLYSRGRDVKNDERQAKQDAENARHTRVMEGYAGRAANRADEDKFTIKEVTDPNTGATGFVRVKTTGGEGPINVGMPAPTAPTNPFSSGGKFNGDQGKAAGFTDRMLQSEAVLSGVAPDSGIGPVAGVENQGTNYAQSNMSKIPGVGNYLVSNDQQKYTQAKADFINAQLRRESGAAIGRDEFVNADKQYFPLPGDKPEVIAQKNANRRAAIEAMGREGGNSYKPKIAYREDGTLAPYGRPAMSAQSAPADVNQPANPATFRAPPKMGELRDGYRFKGGNPGDPSSWVKASN